MSEAMKYTFTKLNNSNYFAWKFKMQLLLAKEKSWKVISDAAPSPVTEEWRNKDQLAYATIGLNVEDDQLVHIRSAKTAVEAWNSLKAYHEKNTTNSKFRLLKSVMAMRLDDGGDMETHVLRINEAFQQMTDLGITMEPDDWKVAVLLGSLPDSYDNLVTALESRPEADLTSSLVQSRLIDEFKRRQYKESSSSGDAALKIGGGGERGSNQRECFFCHSNGHFKRDCMKYKEWLKRRSNSNNGDYSKSTNNDKQKANVAEESSNEFLFLMSHPVSRNDWIIDSGATSHVTPDKGLFIEFDSSHNNKISVANGQQIEVKGKGNIKIESITDSNSTSDIKLTDVLWVPSTCSNLLSVRKLNSHGYEVKFTPEYDCFISLNGRQIARGMLHGNLYVIKELNKAYTAQKHDENCIHQWHKICGHRDIEVIKRLKSDGFVEGPDIIDCGIDEICGICQEGKLTRLPFPKVADKSSKHPLDLIHSDVCGPMQTSTPSGKRFMVTFIDDYTRYTRIYLIDHKSEVADKFKEYINMCISFFGKKPKYIRSDRGGEYTGAKLIQFLADNGIQSNLTAPYTPQQNGVAERKNRTLIEMSRCMLLEAGMENKYWGEAVVMANYMQNRLPTKAIDKTPYEAWFDRKPNIAHFRKFGAKCYVHVPSEKRQKLDPKAFAAILVGYDEQSKAYRCYNPNTRKVVISRDVKFENIHETTVHSSAAEEEYSTEGEMSTSDGNQAPIATGEAESIDAEQDDTTENERTIGSDYFECDDTLIQQNDSFNENNQPLRRSGRSTKGIPPQRLIEQIDLVVTTKEPKTFAEAMQCQYKQKWVEAMQDEISSLQENNTWTLKGLPDGRKAIGCKWVFKIKRDANGNIQRFKARLVAQGFSQKYGDDYDEVFAPVVKQTTFRVLLSIAAKTNMKVFHLDAKTAFLNGSLKETLFMKQPPGFVQEGEENKVCHLNKSIYGLKQAAKSWNDALHQVLIAAEFRQSNADPCLYSKLTNGIWCYVLVYVDDILVASSQTELLDEVQKLLASKFSINNLGLIKSYLGLDISKDKNGIYGLNQNSYVRKVLNDFGLSDAKISNIPLSTDYGKDNSERDVFIDNENYQKLIGCLLYLAVNSRPDISASVSILAQKTSQPTQYDWIELKRILKYLKGTAHLKLTSVKENDTMLVGYADANWAEDRSDRKSNSGYIFFVFGMPVSWTCKKQSCVALSSTEAEFISLSEACKEAVWLRRLLNDFNQHLNTPTVIFEDNQSCLKLIQDEKLSNRSKHIDTKCYFVKDHVQRKDVLCEYCPTEFMLADMLTKPLAAKRLEYLREECGLKEI